MKLVQYVVAGLVLAGAASAANAQQCFRPHDITGFATAPDNRTVYFRVGRRVFQVVTRDVCPELENRHFIELNPVGTSSQFCSPIEADLRVRTAGISATCPLETLRELSPAEIEALPRTLRP